MAKRIFSLAAVCLLGFMLLPAANESAQTVSVAVGSNSPAADDASAAGQLLFPELSDTVYTDTQDFSASFYQEQGDDKYAYVVAGADNERFLKTDAWRVGTLLLTCEGTRIFDASGQETPVD